MFLLSPCFAKACAKERPGVFTLRQAIYWMSMPLNQYTMRLLAHHGFQLHLDVEVHLQRLFYRLCDSRLIEVGHKVTLVQLSDLLDMCCHRQRSSGLGGGG